jgi:hypothetical protein
MKSHVLVLLVALGLTVGATGTLLAQRPDLSGNYIANGGTTTWEDRHLTETGKQRFDAYDFATDDPALKCLAASWQRVWLNPNVLVRITQADDHVQLWYEWGDLDRRIPLVDPTQANPPRGSIEGQPALGHYAAWYDGDALVIDTIDMGPGYVSTMSEFAGLPQSPRMHTIERLSVAGDLLTIETTHVDPTNYQKPFMVTKTYPRSDFEVLPYGCNPDDASVVEPAGN